jgi:hypothetical protein
MLCIEGKREADGVMMSEDFKHRHVGTVAAVIGCIVFGLAFVGLMLNLG